jgi:hypothetical protein
MTGESVRALSSWAFPLLPFLGAFYFYFFYFFSPPLFVLPTAQLLM